MKKILLSVLISLLALSILAIPALADTGSVVGDVDIQVTSETPALHPGDSVDFVYTLINTNSKPITGVNFDVSLPDGITIDSFVVDCASDFGNNTPDVKGKKTFFVSNSSGTGPTTNIKLLTLHCHVEDSAALNTPLSVGLSITEITTSYPDTLAGHPKPLSITVSHKDGQHQYEGPWLDDPAHKVTCTTDGIQYRECKTRNCGARETQKVEALGHQDITFSTAANGGGTLNKFNWQVDSNDKEKATATVFVKCSRPSCPDYYENGQGKLVTIAEENISHENGKATCDDPGTVTFTGEITIPDPVKTEGWTAKDTYEEQVGENGLGHDWTGEVDWSGWKQSNEPFVAKLTCARDGCGRILVVNVTPQKDERNSTPAGCTKGGQDVYTVTADFRNATDPDTNAESKDKVPKDATTDPKTVTLEPKGHDWPDTVDFTWDDTDPRNPTATVEIKCERDDCDSKYKDAQTEDAVVTPVGDPEEPTCTTDGSAKFTATYTTKEVGEDRQNKTYDSKVIEGTEHTTTLDKLGHIWTKPTFNWDGNAQEGWTCDTVTWTCERDSGHTKDEDIAQPLEQKETKADYTQDGSIVFTAKAPCSNTETDKDIFKPEQASETQTQVVPMLVPEASEPTVDTNQLPGVTVEAAGLPDKQDIQTQVQNALKGNPSNLDPELAEQLVKEGDNTDKGMDITTKLVVEDQPQTPTIGGVGQTDIKKVYNIHIDVSVSRGGIGGTLTGHITQTDNPITFTVPQPDNGPIFVVMSDHGGWHTIGSKLDGKNIVFSTNQFSDFAIISSNDLKYATIEPNPIPNQTYTGSEIKPAIKVYINGDKDHPLEENVDYTVEYANNVNVGNGTASITIKAVDGGTYSGEQTISFSIVAKPAAASSGSGTKNAPNTGDETPVALYAGILTLSAAALAVVCTRKKKSSR